MRQLISRALMLPLLCAALAGCSPPLSGTYEDVADPARFYTFSKWTQTWTSYYDQTGDYSVDGNKITLDVGGGLDGTIISEDEFQLQDVPGWSVEKTFNVYRRRAEQP